MAVVTAGLTFGLPVVQESSGMAIDASEYLRNGFWPYEHGSFGNPLAGVEPDMCEGIFFSSPGPRHDYTCAAQQHHQISNSNSMGLPWQCTLVVGSAFLRTCPYHRHYMVLFPVLDSLHRRRC
jgi:hypothetical protein